jgi:hypothetical protein
MHQAQPVLKAGHSPDDPPESPLHLGQDAFNKTGNTRGIANLPFPKIPRVSQQDPVIEHLQAPADEQLDYPMFNG